LEVNDQKSLNVYFDHVAFGEMNLSEQEKFIGDVLLLIQDTDFSTAFLPDIGYVQIEPFKKWRFRAAPRKLNFYVTDLKGIDIFKDVENFDSFFLDIY
jgi:hypothetical protein